MLRHPTVFALFFLTAAAAVLVRAEDDIQVFPTRRSTLSIYSYGGRAALKIAPEQRDGGPRSRRTGALTDVVTNPPLATSPQLSGSAKTPVSSFAAKPAAGAPIVATGSMAFSSPGGFNTAGSLVSTHAETAPPTLPPGSQTVTVAWKASSDGAVVGYHLYSGDHSGHYTAKIPLGNQTSTQVVISDFALYVAVSAYTSEGLESVLSNEVVVSGGADIVIPSGGSRAGAINSSSQ